MDNDIGAAEHYSTLEAVEQNGWANAPELDSTATAPQVVVLRVLIWNSSHNLREDQVVQVDFGPQSAYDSSSKFAYPDDLPEAIDCSEEELLTPDHTCDSFRHCGPPQRNIWCIFASIALIAAFAAGIWQLAGLSLSTTRYAS